MNPTLAFVFALVGFLVAELVEIFLFVRRNGAAPKRCKCRIYWALLPLLACGAGFLALAFETQTRAAAFFVGVAFPFIINNFMRQVELQQQVTIPVHVVPQPPSAPKADAKDSSSFP